MIARRRKKYHKYLTIAPSAIALKFYQSELLVYIG